MSQHELNLKVRLCNVIDKWIQDEAENHDEDWSELDFYCGENLSSLMSDAAFAVLMAQVDAYRYAKSQGIISE